MDVVVPAREGEKKEQEEEVGWSLIFTVILIPMHLAPPQLSLIAWVGTTPDPSALIHIVSLMSISFRSRLPISPTASTITYDYLHALSSRGC